VERAKKIAALVGNFFPPQGVWLIFIREKGSPKEEKKRGGMHRSAEDRELSRGRSYTGRTSGLR